MKQTENSVKTEESATEKLVRYTHLHTLPKLRTFLNSYHSLVQKNSNQCNSFFSFFFQKEPELNHTSSNARPSSSTSQRKNIEEKASLRISHPKTVHDVITITNDNMWVSVLFIRSNRTPCRLQQNRNIIMTRSHQHNGLPTAITAVAPAITAPTMTHAAE